MDIVITYVNGKDPEWQKQYHETTNAPLSVERFRDWDTLKFLFRGIAKYMPFIKNVFLVVAMESQVPEWINREKVKVVFHKDIIPEEYLPTFNSTAIEMFLHRIPGLDEEFIYFNDDFFPIRPCTPNMFFDKGRPCYKLYTNRRTPNMFRKQCKNADKIARKGAGIKDSVEYYLRPQHICTPMLKSDSEEIFQKCHDEICNSLSQLREDKNINQYIYVLYTHYMGHDINKEINYTYFSIGKEQFKIKKFFERPDTCLLCLNDTMELNRTTFYNFRKNITNGFNRHLKDKCKYERTPNPKKVEEPKTQTVTKKIITKANFHILP